MLDPKKTTKIQIKSGCGACEYACRVESGDIVEAEAVESFTKKHKELKNSGLSLEQCQFSSGKISLSPDERHVNGFVFECPDGTLGFILESNVECIMEYPRQLKESVAKKSGVFSRAFMNKVAPDKSPCDIEEKSPSQKSEIKPGTSTTYGTVSTQNYRGFGSL